jgi:hypothetical protein
MPLHELQTKLFRRGIEIAGGAKQLCSRLEVNEHSLQLWLEGRATAPAWIFHVLIDLVLEDDLARAAQDRRREPRPQSSAESD